MPGRIYDSLNAQVLTGKIDGRRFFRALRELEMYYLIES